MSYCGVDEFVPITKLVSDVKVFIPGVAATIAELQLRSQAIMFADRTKALEISIFEDAQMNVSGYPVTLDDCLAVLNIKEVKYNGRCYDRIQNSACSTGGCVSQYGFVVKTPSWIEIYPAPRKDGVNDIEIVVAAGVSADACDLPRTFYERWGQHIVNGALSVLYGMKNEDWYNKGLMEMYRSWAKEGVNEAKRDVTIMATGGSGIPIGGDPWIL